MAIFRRNPANPARRTGEPLKTRSKSFSSSEASHSNAGFTSSSRGSSSGSCRDRRFTIPRANILADIAAKDLPPHARHQFRCNRTLVFDSQIRNALRRIHLVRRDQRASGTRIEAPRACPAMILDQQLRCFLFWTEIQRGQQHREKSKRSQLRMNEAGVLSRPSQSSCRRQRAFYHWSRVDIGSRFKHTELLAQFRIEILQSLQQHLVIIARPAIAICVYAAAPRIARNPPTLLIVGFGRERRPAMIVRKAHNGRPRPAKWRGHTRAQQFTALLARDR